MAVVVFDDGNASGIWSDALNWVGGSLPNAADTADMNADCALDMDDIIAVLDVGAGITLTMNAGFSLTGMTSDMIGTGTIYMNAGCQLLWDSAGSPDWATVNIIARGTSGSRCLLDNVGAGYIDGRGTPALIDCEYTDIHTVKYFRPRTELRLVYCDIEGNNAGADSDFSPATNTILRHCWISNFQNGLFLDGNTASNGVDYRQLENITFGVDRDANVQANGKDIRVNNVNGATAYFRNARFTAATLISWDSATVATGSRIVVENYGFDGTTGTPGVGFTETPYWRSERSTSAKKTGDYGTRVTPKTGIDTSVAHYAEVEIYIPISTGDNISVSVYGRRHTMTNDCAEIEIDPEGAWFTPTIVATTLTIDDTWYEFATAANCAEGPGIGGSGGSCWGSGSGPDSCGMARIVLRLKEYQAAAYFDWADMVVTIT